MKNMLFDFKYKDTIISVVANKIIGMTTGKGKEYEFCNIFMENTPDAFVCTESFESVRYRLSKALGGDIVS